MRVAIVHYWLVNMRGGERVLEEICRLFPQADLFTHVYEASAVSETIRAHRVTETFIARLPAARRAYSSYLPLMPHALEALDLSGYDLVISSEAGPAKGIVPPPGVPHICYCHSPMRYVWDQYHAYRAGAGPLARLAMPLFAKQLRIWDVASAARVDTFLANSRFVAGRIRSYYRREAEVLHPPVDTAAFAPDPASPDEEYYLLAGELVSYKRPDIAIEAFNRLGKPLMVVGEGPLLKSLKAAARPNIRFVGRLSFPDLRRAYARCQALVFPGIEDFGIVPVEVMASGRPVVAYGRGGAAETVLHGRTGHLYDGEGPEALAEAIAAFEASGLAHAGPDACIEQAARFDRSRFVEGFRDVLRRHDVLPDHDEAWVAG